MVWLGDSLIIYNEVRTKHGPGDRSTKTPEDVIESLKALGCIQ